MNDVPGFNRKNKQSFVYTNVKTVKEPERSCCNERNSDNFENKNDLKGRNDSDEVDESRKNIESEEENDSDECSDELEHQENDDNYISGRGKDKVFQVTLQEELNDLVRDLGLPKDGAELLTSFMKKKNYLAKDIKVYYFRNREEKFRKYFTKIDDPSLVYCNDV